MKKTRIIGIILLAALLCGLLTSCNSLKPTEQDLKVVGTVGEYEVTYDSLRYFVLNYKATLGNKYKDAATDPEVKAALEADILDYVMSTITRNYAIMQLCAEFSLDINEEAILEKLEDEIDATIVDCGGKKNYKKALEEQYMTDRFFREYYQLSIALSELTYILADDLGVIPGTDEEIMDFLMSDEFIHTRHICIYKDGSDDEGKRTKLEMVLEKLNNKEDDFESLIGRYSEDYQDTGKGYYFTRGEFDQVYEDASFDLSDEEYSGIVETAYGYYIIKRYAKDDTDEDYFKKNFEALAQQIQYALTYNKVFEIQEKLEFVMNDYGKSLVLSELK